MWPWMKIWLWVYEVKDGVVWWVLLAPFPLLLARMTSILYSIKDHQQSYILNLTYGHVESPDFSKNCRAFSQIAISYLLLRPHQEACSNAWLPYLWSYISWYLYWPRLGKVYIYALWDQFYIVLIYLVEPCHSSHCHLVAYIPVLCPPWPFCKLEWGGSAPLVYLGMTYEKVQELISSHVFGHFQELLSVFLDVGSIQGLHILSVVLLGLWRLSL